MRSTAATCRCCPTQGLYLTSSASRRTPYRRPRQHKRSLREESAMSTVTLADARRVIGAAEKKANDIGQPMNIAVADEGGNIVAHARMDNAWIGSIDISLRRLSRHAHLILKRRNWPSILNREASSSAFMRQTTARSLSLPAASP